MTDELQAAGDRPAAAGSALANLRERRAAAAKNLHLDLAVPRLEPPVYVRFRPVKIEEINRVNAQYAKSKAKDVDVIVNAVILSHACLGVFGEADGQPAGDPETWPRFDSELAQLLGLPEASGAVDVVRGLYLTDGDVIATGSRLSDWSGYAWQDLERDAAGN